jgi:hemoglobin
VERSLYERLGGIEAITAVAHAFDERAGKDDRINQKFARTDLDRLTKEFVDQLCQDTGGPISGPATTTPHRPPTPQAQPHPPA